MGNSYVTDQTATVFMVYIGIVTKESFAKYFMKACYCGILTDGSTDSAHI